MPAIPWQLILKQAPVIMNAAPALVKAAGDLLNSARGRSAEIAAAEDVPELRDRVAELANDQQASAALLKELTDRQNAIAEAFQAAAKRSRVVFTLALAGVLLGCVACLLALLR